MTARVTRGAVTGNGACAAPRTGGYRADAIAPLAAIESGTYWFEARNRLIVWALRRYFPGARSFLEIGCGTGFVLRGVRDARPDLTLAAVEPLSDGLAIAHTRVPEATFTLSDALAFRAPRRFDVVGAFDVLEHIEDDRAAMESMRSATAPRGGILITVPQHPRLWSPTDDYARHVRRYRRRDLIRTLESIGFEVVRATSFVSVLLPAMALSRWRHRRRAGLEPLAELRVAPLVNRCLRAALDLERQVIRAGVSWPAGGSLLVAARVLP